MKSSLLHYAKESASLVLMVVIGLGIGIGAKAGWDRYQRGPEFIITDTSAHFKDVNAPIVVYTTQWCPYCKQTKEYLTANGIGFLERDVEAGNATTDALYASLDSSGVPKIVVGDMIINGFNRPLLQRQLQKHHLLRQ
ncbi:glutaredoxin domain-containing protein [Ferrimonas kyonanensis]|uniref:glutaredoxin domain-containing protein n=1 Tax=Ferrimonas kyonanensis TaxID=364763 RepID=UPI000428A280|nr:glutaredoxin domain-containing protein [Ferrimonas kyonanensis]